MHATDGLGPVSFPSSYGEYADVRIGVICNYAPDDELDDNGNPTLHFQRDTNGNFYNVTMRNLFTTMQTMMTRSGFLPGVAMLFLLSTGRCDGYVHVDGTHIRLVGYHRISSSFAAPTSLCGKHNCICSSQVRKSRRCHGFWAESIRQHPTMVAHSLLPKDSDSEHVSQPSTEHQV